ncbi:MAG TPA: GGDEF domain-containing protein [Acidimicrobiia bacterium]|nr:GGDEF domain-containing protein [Acidimicrobiia bacterium]
MSHHESVERGDRSLVRLAVVRRFPNAVPMLLGVVLVAFIAFGDWVTGPELSFSVLYMGTVVAVTWLGSRRHGTFVAVLAAVESLLAVVLTRGAPTAADVWNASTQLLVLILTASLIGSLRRALVDQRHMAMVDSLTGAMNRRAFQMVAERERLRSVREGTPLSLAYFDLDDFKDINDRLGHAAGDELLSAFAAAVIAEVRAADLFARIGGDEFVLLLPDTDAREAVLVVDRVRKLLVDESRHAYPITTSVGIATYRFPPNTVDALLARADDLLHQAKQRGGDTVVGMVIVGPWTRWESEISRPPGDTRVF